MQIVPSGTKRITTAQQSVAPAARQGVQQEDISPNSQVESGEFNPIGQLDSSLKNKPAKQVAPNQQQLQDSLKFPGTQQKQDPKETIAKNIQNIQAFKEDFTGFVQKFNINMQLITRDKNKRKMLERMFKIAPTTGKGRIEIPGWWIGSDGQRHIIQYTEAYQSLKEMANSHEFEIVPTEMGMGEDVYVFDINPLSAAVEETPALNGLEQMYGNGGAVGGDSEQRKAAESRHSIIKQSHNEILLSLIKSGFGGKK